MGEYHPPANKTLKKQLICSRYGNILWLISNLWCENYLSRELCWFILWKNIPKF